MEAEVTSETLVPTYHPNDVGAYETREGTLYGISQISIISCQQISRFLWSPKTREHVPRESVSYLQN